MPLTGRTVRVEARSTIRVETMSARAEVTGVWNVLRLFGWAAVAGLMLLPLVAMQFTSEVNWTAGDFVFAAVVLGSAGLGTEFLVRCSPSNSYRIGGVLTVLVMFLTMWSNLAVGIIGSEDNPYNLAFLVLIPLAMIGMMLARFRPSGMAVVTALAAAAQAALSGYGLTADGRGGTIGLVFAGLWLVAATLFRSARTE
jgi:hypothetical protein